MRAPGVGASRRIARRDEVIGVLQFPRPVSNCAWVCGIGAADLGGSPAVRRVSLVGTQRRQNGYGVLATDCDLLGHLLPSTLLAVASAAVRERGHAVAAGATAHSKEAPVPPSVVMPPHRKTAPSSTPSRRIPAG